MGSYDSRALFLSDFTNLRQANKALPPAALPSLSMATSAMDPNRGAAAPYESNVGGRRQRSRLLRLIPLLVWGAKMAPIKKLGDGRSTGLGWPPLDDDTQLPTEQWRRQWGGHGRGDATGRNV